MINLNKRMKCIADMVTPGKRVADIGCDHALISIYLADAGISDTILAMDVNEGPLRSAEKNILQHGVSDKVLTRLSDGFSALKENETDAAIISGMGGMLIVDILKVGLSKLNDGYELILSPQSDIFEVRHFLRINRFSIIDEKMLLEDGKFYNVIKAKLDKKTDFLSNDATDESFYDTYGKILIDNKSSVLKAYAEGRLEKLNQVYCHLSSREVDTVINRMAELNREIHELARLIDMLR